VGRCLPKIYGLSAKGFLGTYLAEAGGWKQKVNLINFSCRRTQLLSPSFRGKTALGENKYWAKTKGNEMRCQSAKVSHNNQAPKGK